MDVGAQAAQSAVSAKVIFATVAGAISWVLTYSGLDQEAFAIFGALIAVDFVTGISKARALGQSITSNRARYGILSKASLLILPLVIALGAKGIGQDAGPLFAWMINLLIVSEVYSILGNIYAVRTRKELPEWDVISLMGQKIRDMFEREP